MVIFILLGLEHFNLSVERKGQNTFLNVRQLFDFISSAMAAYSKEIFNNTLWGIIYVVLFSRGLEFYLIPFGFRSRKDGRLKLPKPCLFPCIFSLSSFEFLDNPKLKGYVPDNIICDLKVILENFYQNFYFELNVKFFSDFVQRTMHGHGHGRLAEVKIWNAVSSILQHFWFLNSSKHSSS